MSGGVVVTDELLDELLDLASQLARAAGHLAAEGRRRGTPTGDTKSTATDMVTEWDRASERVIVDGLRAERPDDGLIGEEGSTAQGTSGIGWLIDPIDGTTNFLYDLPGWAVSIAAVDGDGALVGVVYVPSHDEMFTAARGRGAACNGRPIRCGTLADPATALVATGFSYDPARRAVHTARLVHVLPHVRDIRRPTCAMRRWAGSTRTSRSGSDRGTWRRASSSHVRPGAAPAISRAVRPGRSRCSWPTQRSSSRWPRCSATRGRRPDAGRTPVRCSHLASWSPWEHASWQSRTTSASARP